MPAFDFFQRKTHRVQKLFVGVQDRPVYPEFDYQLGFMNGCNLPVKVADVFQKPVEGSSEFTLDADLQGRVGKITVGKQLRLLEKCRSSLLDLVDMFGAITSPIRLDRFGVKPHGLEGIHQKGVAHGLHIQIEQLAESLFRLRRLGFVGLEMTPHVDPEQVFEFTVGADIPFEGQIDSVMGLSDMKAGFKVLNPPSLLGAFEESLQVPSLGFFELPPHGA